MMCISVQDTAVLDRLRQGLDRMAWICLDCLGINHGSLHPGTVVVQGRSED